MLFLLALACNDPVPEETPAAASSALHFDGDAPRNVLMISIDTLRRDRVGHYDGSDRTPTLNRLLSEGYALDDHRSCSSWTWPSVLCVLSGRGLLELGVISPSPAYQPPPLPQEEDLLAEWLQAAGYATGLVTANTFLSEYYGIVQGYGIYNDTDLNRPDTAGVTDVGLETLTTLKAADTPWFLHLHYLDPHDPYDPPAEYRGDINSAPVGDHELTTHNGVSAISAVWSALSDADKSAVLDSIFGLYDAELKYTDTEIGRLLDTMEAQGDLDDTLVVLWSDHGEQFWEHGDWYHRQGLHDEESASVAAFWAKSLRSGATTAPSSHRDLAPTLLDALGISIPEEVLGDVIGTFGPERPRFAQAMKGERSLQSVDCRQRRLIGWWDGERAFYRLDEDPLEKNNVYDPEDPEVIELEALLAPQIELFRELAAGAE